MNSVLQPPVRKVKACTEEIKSALANVSVSAEISPEKARLAAQAFSKSFYGHNYYLNPSEKIQTMKPKSLEKQMTMHSTMMCFLIGKL